MMRKTCESSFFAMELKLISEATDGIALRVTGVLKLLYHYKVEAPTQEMLKALV